MALARSGAAAAALLAVWACGSAHPARGQAAGASPAADAAQTAFDAGRFEDARRLWAAPAEAGDPAAEMGLATLDDLGKGARRDPAAALRWYRRAAEGGRPDAEFNVAVMLDTGDGVARDPAAAASWYGRAAAHGNHRAQYNLSLLYQSGDGVPRNVDAAAGWLRAAARFIPAAAGRLAGLRWVQPYAQAAIRAPAAVRLDTPRNGSVAAVAGAVELVWVPPSPLLPVRYFVQVMALPDGAPAQEAYAAYTDATATLATLDAKPGHYAWRVYSVGRWSRSYAASEWARFDVEPVAAAGTTAAD